MRKRGEKAREIARKRRDWKEEGDFEIELTESDRADIAQRDEADRNGDGDQIQRDDPLGALGHASP